MPKPAALALLLLATATLHAQSRTGPPAAKPIGNIRFGTNGSEEVKNSNLRVLQGKVEDVEGKGVKNAVVFLKDKKDSSVKSIVANDDGTYRFVDLARNRDFEVWAQLEKKKGALKQISQFDDRTQIQMNLKVEESKEIAH